MEAALAAEDASALPLDAFAAIHKSLSGDTRHVFQVGKLCDFSAVGLKGSEMIQLCFFSLGIFEKSCIPGIQEPNWCSLKTNNPI